MSDVNVGRPLPLGRPRKSDREPKMATVSFKATAITMAALRALEVEVGDDVRGRRSVLLRKLILDAFKVMNDARVGEHKRK